ncbi:hypothetical protein GCM10027456_49050 [Kineosporia babensis]
MRAEAQDRRGKAGWNAGARSGADGVGRGGVWVEIEGVMGLRRDWTQGARNGRMDGGWGREVGGMSRGLDAMPVPDGP